LDRATPTPSARVLLTAFVAIVFSFSFAAPSARMAQPFDAMWLAVARLGLAGLAWSMLRPRSFLQTTALFRHNWILARGVALTILIFAIHIAAWMSSLALTSVLRCAVLTATGPLFAAGLSWLAGEKPSPRFFAGCALALLGIAAMASYGQGESAAPLDSNLALWGDLLALLSALTVAFYLQAGRRVRHSIDLSGYLAWVNLGAATLLASYLLVDGQHAWPKSLRPEQLIALGVLGLLPGVVGHGLLNWTVRFLPVHIASLTTLLEPVGAAVLAYLFLNEPIAPVEACGAGALLLGVAIGSRTK
jgi:drug/metabolite transporter (DMT)-like permease